MVEDGVLPWTIQRDAGGRSGIEVVNQDPTGLRQMGREFRLLFDRVLQVIRDKGLARRLLDFCAIIWIQQDRRESLGRGHLREGTTEQRPPAQWVDRHPVW